MDIQKWVGTVMLSQVIFKKKLQTLKGKLNFIPKVGEANKFWELLV